MKIKVTVELYQFADLEPIAKEKAIDHFRDINVEGDFGETIIDSWELKLEYMGVEDMEIRYSGFYSQGDGASFIGHITNPVRFCRERKVRMSIPFIIAFMKSRYNSMSVLSDRRNYVHEKSVSVNAHYETPRKHYEDSIDRVIYMVEQEVYEIGREIYSDLQEEYLYQISDDAVIETIVSNEHLFFESGRHVPREIYETILSSIREVQSV